MAAANTSYNSDLVKQALGEADQATAEQRGAASSIINSSEQGMYDMLGKMQLQNERGIADRRMQALRSGMTSSSLAAMEMQNIQVGQAGAQQVMMDARNQRLQMEMQYAGAEHTNRKFMFDTLNQNAKDYAAIDAQKYSSSMIPQWKEEFPNASPNQIAALSAMFTPGVTLSKQMKADVKALLDGPKTKTEPPNKPTSTPQLGTLKSEMDNAGGLKNMTVEEIWEVIQKNINDGFGGVGGNYQVG